MDFQDDFWNDTESGDSSGDHNWSDGSENRNGFSDDFWNGSQSGDSSGDHTWGNDSGDQTLSDDSQSSDGLPKDFWGGSDSADTLPDDFWEGSDNASPPSTSKKQISLIAKILGTVAAVLGLVFGFLSGKKPPTPTVQEPPSDTTPMPDIFDDDTTAPTYEPSPTWPTTPEQTRPSYPEQTTPPTDPVTPTVPQQGQFRVGYFGQRLSPAYQKIYLQIAQAVANFDDRVPNLILSRAEDISAIVEALHWDYGGDLFWFNGAYKSTYINQGGYVQMTLMPEYRWDKATCKNNAAYVESATRDFLARSAGLSEYEKVKAVYNYLVDNTIYDMNYMGKSVYELFYHGRAVCDAYARSTQYLLGRLGVEVIYVVGDGYSPSNNSWESHAWNIVKVGGQYYQFDSTWGDPVKPAHEQTKRFTYLCVTTEEMTRDHKTDWSLYPNCTATEYNYYVREGYYLASRDPEQIKAWMAQGAQNGNTFEFKAADRSIYNWVMQELIQNKQIFDLFRDSIGFSGTYTYSYSDKFYTVRIDWN